MPIQKDGMLNPSTVRPMTQRASQLFSCKLQNRPSGIPMTIDNTYALNASSSVAGIRSKITCMDGRL